MIRRVLLFLAVVSGCSLNPQPLPPDDKEGTFAAPDGGVSRGDDDSAAPPSDGSMSADAGSDAMDASDAVDAPVDAGSDGDDGSVTSD